MSKKNELATQVKHELAKPSDYAIDYQLEGEERSDTIMPVVILHQGDISAPYYGDFPKGTLLDNSTKEIITARKFACTGIAYKEWKRFEGGRPVYITRSKEEVPAEDLEWSDDNQPPLAEMSTNFVVIFEGAVSPILLPFTSKHRGPRNAAKLINTLEKTRSARRMAPGLYELIVKTNTNDKKQEWKTFDVKPCGDAPDELAAQCCEWHKMLRGQTIRAAAENDERATAASESTFDPDSEG